MAGVQEAQREAQVKPPRTHHRRRAGKKDKRVDASSAGLKLCAPSLSSPPSPHCLIAAAVLTCLTSRGQMTTRRANQHARAVGIGNPEVVKTFKSVQTNHQRLTMAELLINTHDSEST